MKYFNDNNSVHPSVEWCQCEMWSGISSCDHTPEEVVPFTSRNDSICYFMSYMHFGTQPPFNQQIPYNREHLRTHNPYHLKKYLNWEHNIPCVLLNLTRFQTTITTTSLWAFAHRFSWCIKQWHIMKSLVQSKETIVFQWSYLTLHPLNIKPISLPWHPDFVKPFWLLDIPWYLDYKMSSVVRHNHH